MYSPAQRYGKNVQSGPPLKAWIKKLKMNQCTEPRSHVVTIKHVRCVQVTEGSVRSWSVWEATIQGRLPGHVTCAVTRGPRTQRAHIWFTLCCGHLEILNHFEQGTPHFYFALILQIYFAIIIFKSMSVVYTALYSFQCTFTCIFLRWFLDQLVKPAFLNWRNGSAVICSRSPSY